MKLIIILFALTGITHSGLAQDTTYNAIRKQLQEIDWLDQLYRNQMTQIQGKYGGDSKEMKALFQDMRLADSTNLIEVEKLIGKYGWLGQELIGEQANTTLFMVIQHAEFVTQLKYLPLMREAVKSGKAKARQLALLEDRVALRQGKKQIYGSQVSWNMKTDSSFVAPLEDPDNVDKRRADIGLPPLAEYLLPLGIIWDIEQYKKELPAIEKAFFKAKG